MRVKSLYEGKNLGTVLHHMIGHRYLLAYGLKFVILMSADNQLNTILLFLLMSNTPLERFF